MTYNGWTNYETWVTALWIGNEEFTENQAVELAMDNRDPYDLAEKLEEFVMGDVVTEGESMRLAADLLMHAKLGIDWREIASAYLDATADDYRAKYGPDCEMGSLTNE